MKKISKVYGHKVLFQTEVDGRPVVITPSEAVGRGWRAPWVFVNNDWQELENYKADEIMSSYEDVVRDYIEDLKKYGELKEMANVKSFDQFINE